ncbi:Zn-ribbon domain-containing OB-fold protein [Humibacter sp.]|uniref:Zn-ribbon domain-containing OB-fold protein n=1 Tax=Humibacter sp. TaxID=1940291 RepID=UPI002B978C46|nr:Zn-ribbon domain-containing OB-fold protein [Humibacter sp.]HVX09178.1 Zn-ribbon domain-containing OB-fold protein [Humibacter sp.]
MTERADVADARPTRPAPVVTEDSAVFWDAAKEGELVAQRCECGRLRHPPRPMCPHCHSTVWSAEKMSGAGVVHSFALLHHPKHPAYDYPVVAATVDLPEGIRLVTQIVAADPTAVSIGMAVRVRFCPTAHHMAVPVFTPEELG